MNTQNTLIKLCLNWKIILPTLSLLTGGLMALMGVIGMSSFILEETLQTQGFGYAICMMNKQWYEAQAALLEEKPFMEINARVLTKKWNPITGHAFRAYAAATIRKLRRDESFIEHMIQKEKLELYQAKLNHEVYR